MVDHATTERALPEAIGGFAIERELGRGGFGVVYLGRDPELNHRSVAIKVFDAGDSDSESRAEMVARFLQEARVTATLTSPHTARLIGVGATADGRPYHVMEFAPGVPLDRLLGRHGRMRETDVARIAMGVLISLAEAHERGLVHRDVKPSNIVVAPLPPHGHPFARLIDFGIVRIVESQRFGADPMVATKKGVVLGSLYFVPPAQLMGARPDPAMDVFAVGMTMATMLDGTLPYWPPGDEMHRALMSAQPVPLGRGVRGSWLHHVVERATRKRTAERFADAREMLLALEEAIGIRLVEARDEVPLALDADGDAWNSEWLDDTTTLSQSTGTLCELDSSLFKRYGAELLLI